MSNNKTKKDLTTMATNIFLGLPPPNIANWIREHASPAGHADTWYKYEGDTVWKHIDIEGALSGVYAESRTDQIQNIDDIVALDIGTNVTSIIDEAFRSCLKL